MLSKPFLRSWYCVTCLRRIVSHRGVKSIKAVTTFACKKRSVRFIIRVGYANGYCGDAGKRRRIRPKQQRLVPLRKGVLLGFVPIRPTWKAVSLKRLETATEKVMALVDAKPEQVHIEYESEECEMEILKGFEVINLKQPKGESVMTVTSNSLKFNKATAVELNYAPYIKVLLNAKTRQIAIQPCSEKDPNAIKFSNEESKQTYAISIKVPAIQVEFRRMLPFEDDNGGKLSYTLNGTLYPDEQVVIYDIGDVKPETEKKRRGRRKKSEIEAEQKEN